MKKANALAVAALALAASLLPAGCDGVGGGAARPRRPAKLTPAPAAREPGAFDVIKLCRFSNEVGPVYFAHALHADLRDAGGARIACLRCHHAVDGKPEEPPRGCAKCHLPHDHSSRGGLPAT